MRELLNRIRDWFRRDRLTRELDEELRFHADQLRREVRSGDVVEDRRRASVQLGNTTKLAEEARERWSVPWMDHLQQDVRYALRGLRRSPGFTIVVVLTLGLGVGANGAMFAVIDRLMFRPYPYLKDPSRVHRVYVQYTDRGRVVTEGDGIEYTRYGDMKKWTTSFSQIAAFAMPDVAVGTGESVRERPVGMVSASFFSFFSARPALGRFFTADEDSTPYGTPVAVLSWAFWQSDFGGRADVLNTPLLVKNVMCTIIGVAPEGFVGVNDGHPPQVFIPITAYAGAQRVEKDPTNYFTRYNWGWLSIMVRRKPGVTLAAANADLSASAIRSWNTQREYESGVLKVEEARPTALAGPMKTAAGPDPGLEARTAGWVMAVALIVLIIACSNVANLFLARALKRRRETALRLALGVKRFRLASQWFIESLLLSLFGCAAGVAIAEWGGALIKSAFMPSSEPISVLRDWRTLSASAALAVAAGVATAMAPVLTVGREDVAGSLKAGVREGTYHRSRTRSVLLVLQGTLSVMLLVGAALFVRSLNHVRSMRLGYDADPALLVLANARGTSFDSVTRVALGRDLLARAQSLPGVESAAWMSSIPFRSTSSTNLSVPGVDSVRRLGRFTYNTATPDYFKAMGTRILRGRAFTADDRQGTPRVAVVSETMARTLWPDRDAIGQCMSVGGPNRRATTRADSFPCVTVIGIAEDAAQRSLIDEKRLRYYMPIDQYHPEGGEALVLRMTIDPAAGGESVRRALQLVMPGQSYVTVTPMRNVVDEQRLSWRVGATMFGAFGVLALVVAAIGLYGVIAYNVAQRMHELGVRVALGAQRQHVVRLVVGQGIRFAVAGVAIGTALALIAGHWIEPLLFQQSPRDPAIYVGVATTLIVVAILASALPALRATRADPSTALRAE